MTKERFAGLRAICDAATKGPWDYNGRGDILASGPADDTLLGQIFTVGIEIATGASAVNAAFCSEARDAMPDLLDEVERWHKAFGGESWVGQKMSDPEFAAGVHQQAIAEIGELTAEIERLKVAIWSDDSTNTERGDETPEDAARFVSGLRAEIARLKIAAEAAGKRTRLRGSGEI